MDEGKKIKPSECGWKEPCGVGENLPDKRMGKIVGFMQSIKMWSCFQANIQGLKGAIAQQSLFVFIDFHNNCCIKLDMEKDYITTTCYVSAV